MRNNYFHDAWCTKSIPSTLLDVSHPTFFHLLSLNNIQLLSYGADYEQLGFSLIQEMFLRLFDV